MKNTIRSFGWMGLAILLLASNFAWAQTERKITDADALAWTRAICRGVYLPLGEKGKAVVFIEISTSADAWVGGAARLQLPADFLSGMGSEEVTFYDGSSFEQQIGAVSLGGHVLRAVFFPFASVFSDDGKRVSVPVRNGDVMVWRQSFFHLKNEDAGTWEPDYGAGKDDPVNAEGRAAKAP